jgi:hypothetical protein
MRGQDAAGEVEIQVRVATREKDIGWSTRVGPSRRSEVLDSPFDRRSNPYAQPSLSFSGSLSNSIAKRCSALCSRAVHETGTLRRRMKLSCSITT